MNKKEYHVKVYRLKDRIEHNYKIVLPDLVDKVETRFLNKQQFADFKKALNEFVEFVNGRLTREGQSLDKKLKESGKSCFEFELTINLEDKKDSRKPIKYSEESK